MRMPAIAAIFRSQLASGLKGNGAAQRASLRMIKAIEADIATADNQFFKVMVDYKASAEIEIERRRKPGRHRQLRLYSLRRLIPQAPGVPDIE